MMKKVSKKLLLAVTLCVANSVYAAPPENTNVDNNLDKYKMDEFVVTATRTELTQKEVPQSVEVITKEDIQNIGAINVKDALRLATNVDLYDSSSHKTRIGIRGGDSNDVLILINGRRVADEGIGMDSGNEYALDRINISNIERIEILRGSAGALYGSDAMSGVINVITRKSEKPGVSVGVAAGSRQINNYYHFDSGKSEDSKLSATFDASFKKERYFKWADKSSMGYNSRVYGYVQNYNLDMDYEMDENNKLNLFAEYVNSNLQYDKFKIDDSFNGIGKIYTNRKTSTLTYSGKNDNSNYSLATTYSQLEREDKGDKYRFWNVEGRDTINTSDNNRFTFGGEYSITKAPTDGTTHDSKQYALYIHDEYSISDKLLVIPSVRYDHHDSFGSHTSPNIGATYFFNDNSRLKANYGEGYRAPDFDELYYANDMIIGNPDLKPEKSKGYEISYEHEWKDTSAKATYFNNKKEDAIELNMLGDLPYHYENVSSTSSQGVEFEIKHELGDGFTLVGNYDYLDAQNDETNTRLAYNARNAYTVKLIWTEPARQEWSVTAWNKWYSDYRYDDKDYSINTFNFVVNKRWGDKYRAFFGIDNLFNKEINEMRYSGRLWRVGAEMTF